jgi:hypothetical protein
MLSEEDLLEMERRNGRHDFNRDTNSFDPVIGWNPSLTVKSNAGPQHLIKSLGQKMTNGPTESDAITYLNHFGFGAFKSSVETPRPAMFRGTSDDYGMFETF